MCATFAVTFGLTCTTLVLHVYVRSSVTELFCPLLLVAVRVVRDICSELEYNRLTTLFWSVIRADKLLTAGRQRLSTRARSGSVTGCQVHLYPSPPLTNLYKPAGGQTLSCPQTVVRLSSVARGKVGDTKHTCARGLTLELYKWRAPWQLSGLDTLVHSVKK